MKKFLKTFKNGNQEGFSLLELVIGVGIMLVLTAGGLLAYNGITANARQASVQRAANEIYDNAVGRYTGTVKGIPTQADDDWMDSANNDNQIKASVEDLGNGRYEVKAWYGSGNYENSKHKSIRTTPEGGNSSIPGDGSSTTPPEESENPGAIEGSNVSTFTFICDETTTAPLPAVNFGEDTKITLNNDTNIDYVPADGSIDLISNVLSIASNSLPVNNHSVSIPMESGVTNTVRVEGSFEYLSHSIDMNSFGTLQNCLTSINLGSNIGLKQVSYIDGNKLNSFENLPSSVESLDSAFKDISHMGWTSSSHFNQDISNWDTSNVSNMRQMFRQNTAFNNGNKSLTWNTSSLVNVKEIFYMSSFNQDIGSWNTSNVKDMSHMFVQATSFNQDISNWDVSNVVNMDSMFSGATAFNNGEEPMAWNTSSVTNMIMMFEEAKSFNADISNWDTKNVTSMRMMFNGASNFNNGEEPGLSNRTLNWDISSLDFSDGSFLAINGMFRNASSFNQDLSSWIVDAGKTNSGIFEGSDLFEKAHYPRASNGAPIGGW